MSTGFVHLHVHSEHSELDSTARVADIIAAAKSDGQPAVAITDHGTLAGIYTAMQEGKEAGVKVIPGIEAYVAIGSRHERNTIEVPADGATTDSGDEVRGGTKVKKYDHLTILATNRTGWANLVAMHNASQHSRWGKHPRIDYELLAEHAEGLVVLTGCLGGPVMGPLSRGDEAAARQGLEAIIEAVGKDNVYVEVMEHGIPQETATLPKLAKLAKSYGLPLVATNDSHHVHADGAYAHEAWLAMQTQKTLAHPSPPRFAFDGTGYHMRTADEMRAVRSEKWWAKACDNTVELAARVSPDMMPEHYLRLPKFPVPEGFEDSREYLIHLVKEGAKQRWGDPYPREVAERLNAELRVYTELGVIDYCLIVHELITWARSQGIPVGPGRGCLVGDDLVWTTEGYKALRDVRIGDTVRTHTGALRQVANTMRYDCDEPLVQVRAYSDGRGATMTGDHKVLVVRAERETDRRKLAQGYRFAPEITNRPQWVQAKDIEVGDLVLTPRPASPGTAPDVIDIAPLLPEAPDGVEYRVTADEIVERVPTNKPYPHSVREVAAACGVARNVIRGILSSATSFDDAPSASVVTDPRSGRMRDRVVRTLQARGFASLAEYNAHLESHRGATRYPHSATVVAREAGVSPQTLRRVAATYPDSGAITHVKNAPSASSTARQRLARELRSRGFSSFTEWDAHIRRNAVYEVRTPRHVRVSSDLLFLLGAWASNGWLAAHSGRVTGWAERASTADDTIQRLVQRVWGLDVIASHHSESDLVQYDVRSAAVRALFRHLADSYELTAQTKRLPEWVGDLSTSGKRAVLGGLWWGDGSVAGGRWQYSTSSPRLAHQVRDLLWAVGAPAGLDEDARIDERPEYANRSLSWRIRTTPNFQPAVTQFGWTDEDYVYQRVRSVEQVAAAGEVFDIEVPVDHSYMTDSYVVHNSAAGSAVSYALGIVGVDPLRFDLLFERFLDPTRVGMPDIDIDFPKERRDEVLAHLVDMYGEDFVARIGTFQVAKTKASLKSAARVLSHPASLGDRLSKILPMKGVEALPFSELDKRRSEEAAGFWEAVDADPRAQEVVDLARQFEHVITGPSIHACGVVISDVPLTNLVPMRKDTGKGSTEDDPLVTEWDAAGVDDGIGLLKLDVLGLRTMDIVAAAARNVEELTGEHIDIDQLPDGDDLDNERVAKTWQLISRGHTEGLFQLESRGMTELAQDVRPASMEHLAALVALFRPGPLSADMHTRYAARKNGREEVDYGIFTDDPAEQEQIARVLDTTYGVAVYQEQYMRLGDVVAGFGPAERNRLRKAVSKKIAAEVDAVGELFIAGATSDEASDGSSKLAFSARTAQRVWDAIKGGADYVFNKSHAVAYGQLAYVTAFLKANWPAAFGAAVLSHTDNEEKRAAALTALSQEGIKVLPPQINSGQVSTTARDAETVVLGLGEIAGVGMAARAIVAERDKNGPFTCAADILNRTVMPGKEPGQHSKLTVTTVEALIEAGALDEFGPRQGQMRVLRAKADRPDTVVPADEWGLVERAVRQHQRLGLSLGRHPMSALSDQVRRWNPDQHDESGRPLSLKPMGLHKVLSSGKSDVATVGLVTGWKVKADNRGGQRADLRLEGSKGRIEAVVWDNTLRWLRRSGHEVGVGSVVGVRARVRAREIEQQDEEGNTVITTVHSLTVVKMWPIDYTDVDATVDRTDLGLDLAGLLYNPDKPMLSLVPGTTGKQSAKVSPDRPGKAPKDRKAKDKPRPTQPVGTDEAVLVLRYGAVPTTGRPWLVKTHPEVADAPAEYADPHEQVRVFRVPAASSPQSQQRPPLYVVALPPGADPGDPKWQQIELPAHPDDTQWQPVDYSRWEVFHPDVRPALVAV